MGWSTLSGNAILAVPTNNVFSTTAARDTYFTANPAKKINGIFVQAAGSFYQWNATSSTWDSSAAIVKGDKGDKGDPGSNGAQGSQGIQGIQGIQGATGATGASGIAWKGQYSAVTAYMANDAVGYNGSTYYCILSSTGNLPTNTTYWQPLALQGAQGIQGVQGIQGIQGASGGDIGDIKLTAIASPTTGWLLCDGSFISRETYACLFAVIGTNYGAGDGTATFNVPNLKGRVPVGCDSTQTEFNTVGKTGGAKTHKLTVTEMPSHNHSYERIQGLVVGREGGIVGEEWAADDNPRAGTTGSSGGDGYHNNLQPYITLNYVIKY